MATTFTTAQIAEALNTTPRELRKFLRADARANGGTTPGKGGRYALPGTKSAISKMATKFATWQKAQEEANAARLAAKETELASVRESDETDSEPTDADLDAIEDEV